MTKADPSATSAVLFSGGLDSAVLLGEMVAQGVRLQPLYISARLAWEKDELSAARAYCRRLGTADPVVLDLPMDDVYGEHWSVGSGEIPSADSSDEAVFLPGRNAVLLVKAAVWCHLHGIKQLALGVLASNPFGDATRCFFDAFEAAMNRALGSQLEIVRPLAALTKHEVMERGRHLPLGLTFSCIAPAEGMHCGACNKCAERRAAFRLAGLDDPTHYKVARPNKAQE